MFKLETGGEYNKDWWSAFNRHGGLFLYRQAGSLGRALIAADIERYNRDRMIQEEEFKTLKNAVKTVNYGSAITNPSDVSGNVKTTEEQQIAAALALEEEEDLLGQRGGTLGSGSLLKGLK